ncbi:hypothetical protein MUA01_14800 [Enterobacteriaceae bacterium H18W14]|uniref:hypothetical protein n=1 Tax=Dryocola boscaweniae TaxID=2925397 RepID=UPI0022EFEAA4|nr:hypothetical protein [Dryocola boscaweniae]MCT4716231.1 hypothetical protein [Dryocola boscaweniae]
MKIDGSNATRIASTHTDMQRKPVGIERVSGHICPQTGYWQLLGSAVSPVVNVKKGTILPFYQGQPVGWRLKEYDLSAGIDD